MSLLIKGVTDFLGLADTPSAYTGHGEELAQVNAAENALEFIIKSRFNATKIFDGATESPPTIYFTPLTASPSSEFSGDGRRPYEYGAIVVGDHLYFFGGQAYTAGPGPDYTNLHYRYNFNTGLREKRASVPTTNGGHTGFYSCSVGYHGGKIYWLCMYDGPDYEKAIKIYDIASDSWQSVATPAIGDLDECWIATCSDALYVHQSGSAGANNRFDKMDYATHAWTALAASGQRSKFGGVIGDEVYAVLWDATTRTYDKVGNTWSNTGQNCFASANIGSCYNENSDSLWARVAQAGNWTVYKYTPAGGWVAQFTEARDAYSPEWLIQRADANKTLLAVEGVYWNDPAASEYIKGGVVSTYIPAGVWELLTQAFLPGDLLIIRSDAGIPVHVELNGAPILVSDGLNVAYVIDGGDYYFSLSKNFSKESVQIWRAIWG